eukprot:g78360.t1
MQKERRNVRQEPKSPAKASAHSCAPARLSIPDDVWKLVRECLKISDVAALALVNRQLNQLVTGATGFWQGFRQPEIDLSQQHHRQLLALYRGKAKTSSRCEAGISSGCYAHRRPSAACVCLTTRKSMFCRRRWLPCGRRTRSPATGNSFSVLSSQSHFGPDDDQEEKVPTSEEKSKTWQKLNGRPFQCLEGLADLRRLEVRYRFMGNFDWLSQLETLPLVEEPKLDPVRVWHLEKLARLANVATKLKKLELGWKSDVTQTGLASMAKFRSLCHLDLCGDILEMDERIDFRPLSTLPLRHLGISFRGDENTEFLRDLLRVHH